MPLPTHGRPGDEILADIDARRSAGLAAALAQLDPDTVTAEAFSGLVAATGLDLASGETGRMATVNTLLDAAPIRLRETLLERFLGLLFTPAPAAGYPVT